MGQIEKTLEIRNVYPCRIAFRIQCNAPTRYIVNPNKGFIGVSDKMTVSITLIDGPKYASNHRFIVQAMPAPGDFSDRKIIWKEPNMTGIMTNTKVRTMHPANVKPGKVGGTSSNSTLTSVSSSGSLASTPTSSNESIASPIPDPKSIDHGEFGPKIEELTEHLKKIVDEKKNRANEMVTIVNEIKSIEVELDRQTQLVNELNERIKNGEIQYSGLVVKEMKIREDIEKMKFGGSAPI